MITEIAKLSIDPANGDAFERAVASCIPLFEDVPGWHGLTLEREIEDPANYHMRVTWESVEAHKLVQPGPAIERWKAQVTPFYVSSPFVVHADAAIGPKSATHDDRRSI